MSTKKTSLIRRFSRMVGMEEKFPNINGDGDPNARNGNNNNTKNSKSPLTLNANGLWDVVPRLDHYRLSRRAKRPSLGELHEGNTVKDINVEAGQVGPAHEGIKLGWIQGVLIPCLLNIWGVMLFLRLSWVVAQAGIFQSLVIIGISAIVCVITTLSLSAISTNGEVKGGGIYFIISRSLGPEFGASVGIVFAFANAVAASMNTIGFCDSLNDLLKSHGLSIVDGGVNDVRIVGVVAILVMVLICAIGMEWESKAQNFLIAIIVLAIFDFLIGVLLGPNDVVQLSKGFAGFSTQIFKDNWGPDYRYYDNTNQTFFSVFAIFFPSVTGIQAGANISGDLKDPASSIPVGTLLALLISMLSYVLFVFFAGGAALRDVSGIIINNGTNATIASCIPGVDCEYGLHNSYSVMQLMSLWAPFIYAGCFAATISTALTNLLSVPRLIQALGQDRIYPGLIYFSKGYGKNNEPYRGYVLTFFVAAVFLLIANLNVVAPLISNFYLASYALINFCTFHAALVRPLGWRPTFKFYNTWVSLVGFVLCVAIMFLIDWVTSVITFVVIFALYLIVVYRKPDVNWGSSTQAQTYKTALSVVYRLNSMDEHVKNYAPQILALSGTPSARPALLHLANLITKNNSLLISGDVHPTRLSYRERSARLRSGYAWLHRHRIKAFYHVVGDLSLERGASALMQATGVGKLAPNVVLMGYKTEWASCNNRKELQEYFNVLHNAFDQKLAVAILRTPQGLNRTASGGFVGEDDHSIAGAGVLAQSSYNLAGNTLMHADSDLSMSSGIPRVQSVPAIGTQFVSAEAVDPVRDSPNHFSARDRWKSKRKHAADKMINEKRFGLPGCSEMPEYATVFQKKHKTGTIDVWWLYDDGGLTILLPYIISTRTNWEHCKMRIFALANHKQEMLAQEKEMAEIMAKFRIKYTSLKLVDDISVEPRQETREFFDKLVADFGAKETSEAGSAPTDALSDCTITETELQILRDKTHRQLRLRELLLENSSQSTLVVMSLPMPRKGAVSAPLYMAWLEALTRDMPPTILVRGNHTSVLTFYS